MFAVIVHFICQKNVHQPTTTIQLRVLKGENVPIFGRKEVPRVERGAPLLLHTHLANFLLRAS